MNIGPLVIVAVFDTRRITNKTSREVEEYVDRLTRMSIHRSLRKDLRATVVEDLWT